MSKASTINPSGIMSNEIVAAAIRDIAGEDESLWGICQERAVEAAEAYGRCCLRAGVALDEKQMQTVAVHAVRSLDPEHGHKFDPVLVMRNCLGHEHVPANLRLSWEGEDTPPLPNPGEISPARTAELVQMQGTAALVDQAVMDMAPVSEALGRIKAAEFFRHVGDVIIAQTFVDLRNSKKYKDYPIKDAEGNLRRCQNFEEFCQLAFGKSYTRCYELSKNLHLLGPELYESAERIGFKARDYAALKALPAEEQEIVKTALAAESKEQVLDILQDLAARNQSERQAAKKQTEDLKADLDARDRLLADKSEKLDKVSLDLEKLKSLPPNKREALRLEQEQEAAKKLTIAVVEAQTAINTLLGQLAEIKAAEVSVYTKEHADQVASWFCQQIQLALQTNGIQADMAEIVLPEWMRDAAQQSPVEGK